MLNYVDTERPTKPSYETNQMFDVVKASENDQNIHIAIELEKLQKIYPITNVKITKKHFPPFVNHFLIEFEIHNSHHEYKHYNLDQHPIEGLRKALEKEHKPFPKTEEIK